MNKCGYFASRLPDIEIYGGETTPWEIVMMTDEGKPYTLTSTSGYACVLTITPFKVTTGIGDAAVIINPLLTKNGTINKSPTNAITALFTFSQNDTIGLRGKYIYQVEVSHGTDKVLCQGHLLIKQNIHR